MQAERVFLGLGSNLGNRTEQLRAGLAGLKAMGLSVRAVSSMYLTEPVLATPSSGVQPRPGVDDSADSEHPWYVNCVAAIEAIPDPAELLEMCLEIERRHGRERRQAAARACGLPRPRTLDIDVLLLGNAIVDEPALQIPHPRMSERRFVLQPLAEIAPQVCHPVSGATITELLNRLPPGQRIWLLAPPPNGAL